MKLSQKESDLVVKLKKLYPTTRTRLYRSHGDIVFIGISKYTGLREKFIVRRCGRNKAKAKAARLRAARQRGCRGCGCTDANACPGGCWWITDDLCDQCHVWADNFTQIEINVMRLALEALSAGNMKHEDEDAIELVWMRKVKARLLRRMPKAAAIEDERRLR